MAAVAAIVTLLEEQFQGQQGLWVLIARKARDYLAAEEAAGMALGQLLAEARARVKALRSVMEELREARNASGAVDELLTALTS